MFSTTEDDQTVVRIHVVQGEREMARDNKTLGRFELVGLPPAPRGVPQIEVTLRHRRRRRRQRVGQGPRHGPLAGDPVTAVERACSEAEIERLVPRRPSSTPSADRERRELVDLRNQADGLIYSTERTLEEFEENVSGRSSAQALADARCEAARAAAAADDVDAAARPR